MRVRFALYQGGASCGLLGNPSFLILHIIFRNQGNNVSILTLLLSLYSLLSVDERRKSRHQQGVQPAPVAVCDLFQGLISLKE